MTPTEKLSKSESKNEWVVSKDELPIVIVYNEKRYILILTKNDKLVLNKYAE